MTEEYKALIRSKTKEFANRALRVLGAAYKIYDNMRKAWTPLFWRKSLPSSALWA
jgi:magnesium-transporting ATPase (P-type)